MKRTLCIFVALMIAGALQAVVANVQLKPNAQTTGPFVQLDEVAVLTGDYARFFNDVTLGRAPAVDETCEISLAFVKNRLRRAGADLAKLRLSGARIAEVSRVDQLVSFDALEAAARESLLGADPKEDTSGGRLEVEMIPSSVSRIRVPEGEVSFKAVPFTRTLQSGEVDVEVNIMIDNRPWQQVKVPCKVLWWHRMPVACSDLKANTLLQPHHMVMEEVSVENTKQRPMDDFSLLLGKKLTRAVKKGQTFSSGCVEAAFLVVRGDQVCVKIADESFSMTTIATAMERGVLGQSITLEYKDSGKRIEARVTGAGQAEITVQ